MNRTVSPPIESVLEGPPGVRGRTDQPALLGTEGLQIGVAVHVRDRHDIGVGLGGQLRPGGIDL